MATAGRRSASLTWVQGADGGSELTFQVVRIYSGKRLVSFMMVPGWATSATVDRLNAGTNYAFSVTAINAVGWSYESARSNTVKVLKR